MTLQAAPLISFVVPCYNYARFLPDCLNSILDQKGDFDFELIVIDDASTDDTADVIRSFSDPRIRVITHLLNMGHAQTIDEGLRESRGRYVARIDPDDRYRPYFLKETIEKLEMYPEVGMTYGDVAIINERGQINVERCDSKHDGRDFKGNELVQLMEKNFICAPSVIARREAWIDALPVPEGLAFNDWYFTLMMARKWEFYYVNRVLADYRIHDSNHHHKIVVNKSEEGSIFWLLDRICNEVENNADLERQKQQASEHIYGAQYLDMANKYFGCGFNADARRCYMQALLHRPSYCFNAGVTRRLVGTLIGRRAYEFSKARLRAVLSR